MSIWSRLTSGIAGFGVGAATADTVEPVLEPLKQTAWRNNPARTLSPGEAAHAATRGLDTAVDFPDDAAREGIGPARYAVLRDLAVTYPGLAELDKLSNRSIITDPAVIKKALHRHGFDDTFTDALIKLFSDILSVSEVANAVQQGHLPDPGILPEPSSAVTPASAVQVDSPDGQPPTTVPLTQINLDPIKEAAGSGYDLDRLKVIANLSGLPPGPAELLHMWNRGLIDESSVDAGLREGHLKTKWAGAQKRLRWSVLSHIQYVDARVRGWIDNAEMYKGGQLNGFVPAQMDMLHRTHGRPLSWRDIWRGIQRGGHILDPVQDRPPEFANMHPDFLAALRQSDIQQQWYQYAWVDRFSKFSPFFVFRAVGKGADPAWAKKSLEESGYDPVDIDIVMKLFLPGAAGSTTIKKDTVTLLTQEYLSGVLSPAAYTTAVGGLGYTGAQATAMMQNAGFKAASAERTRNTRLTEKQFVGAKLSEGQARQDLAQLGWPQGVIDNKVAAWIIERNVAVTTLTVGQIEKALKAGALTAAEATPLLEDLGENAAAIATIIASNPPKP